MNTDDLKTVRTKPAPFFDERTTVRLSASESPASDAAIIRWLAKPALNLVDLAGIESQLIDGPVFHGPTAAVLADKVRDLVNAVSGIDKVRAQKVAERLERQR